MVRGMERGTIGADWQDREPVVGRRRVAAVRSELAVHLVTRLGLSLADGARQLGVSASGIAKAVARAEHQ
jgi:hypothetical protein